MGGPLEAAFDRVRPHSFDPPSAINRGHKVVRHWGRCAGRALGSISKRRCCDRAPSWREWLQRAVPRQCGQQAQGMCGCWCGSWFDLRQRDVAHRDLRTKKPLRVLRKGLLLGPVRAAQCLPHAELSLVMLTRTRRTRLIIRLCAKRCISLSLLLT